MGAFKSDRHIADPLAALHVVLLPTILPESTETSKASDAPSSLSIKHAPASLDAPPPPTAEEWRLASTYTLKNSKRYRYTWGQQVRSMMGTAVEGPDQGVVRFAIEIAPSGEITRIDTIWSTSEKAESLARAAIATMPPLPPTPTGEPLIFEKTISFQPFETGWPPIYKFDCLPEPPRFNNPWVWDGRSALETNRRIDTVPAPQTQPRLKECPDLPPDTVDAEAADIQRQFDMWESGRLDQRKSAPRPHCPLARRSSSRIHDTPCASIE